MVTPTHTVHIVCVYIWNAVTVSSVRPSVADYFTASDDEEPQSCWHGTYTRTLVGLYITALLWPIAVQTDTSVARYHYDNGNWAGELSQCAGRRSVIIKTQTKLSKAPAQSLKNSQWLKKNNKKKRCRINVVLFVWDSIVTRRQVPGAFMRFRNHNEVISIKMHSHVCHDHSDPDTFMCSAESQCATETVGFILIEAG